MLLDDLGDLLTTEGLGTVGTDIFLSRLPDLPNQCISIFESGGFASLHTMGNSPVAENPSVQIICRATNYQDARILSNQVDVLLNGLRNRTINGVLYKWISGVQSPFGIGRDGNEREEVSCNYDIIKSNATSS